MENKDSWEVENRKRWDTLRHLVVQTDKSYMKSFSRIQNYGETELYPESRIIENIISIGFENHRSFLEKLIHSSKPYKKDISSKDLDIVSEITGYTVIDIFDRMYENKDESFAKYFRSLFTNKMRQALKALYINNPDSEDLENWQILFDLKGNKKFRDRVMQARKDCFK